ncbi:hypothetical protein [Megamonas sp.]|uniref:hypothetical protein n=1 Tax=Megamonas sp. TaxID=2049033 RepID=UPI0025910056|nr:hypothetical protein [Megamonas sp.]
MKTNLNDFRELLVNKLIEIEEFDLASDIKNFKNIGVVNQNWKLYNELKLEMGSDSALEYIIETEIL